MSEIFNFMCYINPPTKNENRYKTIRNRRTGKPMQIKNKNYFDPWELIHSQMFTTRYGMSKYQFENLTSKEKIKLQKELTKKNVIVSLWNGFHRIDLLNFANELLDRLEGIAYVNDRQVKQCNAFKDDESKTEYFKIIVETE